MTDMSLSLVYPPTCRWHDAAGYCGRTDVRPYPCGQRCPIHTPAALAGRAEPQTPTEQQEQQ